jgi:hypothetical protein
MVLNLPAVVLLGVCTWLLYRSRTMRAFEIWVVGGFGFFLARTALSGPITSVFAALGHALTHL